MVRMPTAVRRLTARRRGLIVLTDSDGAGLVIRNFLRGALPKEGVLHAYVPEIAGKEKRKAAPGKAGLLGVEGMTPEILLEALRNAGAEMDGEARAADDHIGKMDLYTLGLSGGAGSAAKRQALLQDLRLPGYLSANALVDALNSLWRDRDQLEKALHDAPPADGTKRVLEMIEEVQKR